MKALTKIIGGVLIVCSLAGASLGFKKPTHPMQGSYVGEMLNKQVSANQLRVVHFEVNANGSIIGSTLTNPTPMIWAGNIDASGNLNSSAFFPGRGAGSGTYTITGFLEFVDPQQNHIASIEITESRVGIPDKKYWFDVFRQ